MTTVRIFGDRDDGVSYTKRPAAYVVILDEQSRVACVSEQSGLFLPGGGLEAGEDALAAIHREVAEECARELEVISSLDPAIQFHFTRRGLPYELQASFFTGRFGAELDRSPEHELQWCSAKPETPPFFHACHRWAVQQALSGG